MTIQDELIEAVREGNVKGCEAAIAVGADVNMPNINGRTPLHDACSRVRLQIVDLLIGKYYVDVDQPDNNGRTPLHIACINQDLALVDLLLKYGANVNLPNSNGSTPLYTACGFRNTAVVDLLLKHGANVNLPNSKGLTALHITCAHGYTEVVDLLLKHGANINQPDHDNFTPLHYACYKGSIPVVKLLIKHGATENVTEESMRLAIPDYIAAQQWCKNAFQDHIYNDLNLLSEEAKNVIKTIVANRFIGSAEEIDRFFTSHSSCDMLQTARDDITEITLNGNADEVTKAPDLDGMNLSGDHHDDAPHGDV
ncbi:MAG: ankyrin repeat domain-containing protein [Rickettsiaceae bacterium]|nr:ankyrin repeat domain-containing protein [Rickettsiaceae bacterium]